MQIIVSWSNGTQSELEVTVPPGATATSTSFNASLPPAMPPTALHQQPDGSWACYSQGPNTLQGFCLPPKMSGRPVAGITWAEAQQDPGIARSLQYFKEAEWTRNRELRLANAKKFHFHGHATEQAAIDCYQDFLRVFGQKERD